MIICAGNNETFPFAKPIGVGLIQSAITLTKLCIEKKPEYLLFIGSAGSYGKHKIFDIVKSKKAANIELSFFEYNSYTPIENIVKNKNKLLKSDVTVNSSNYISKNKKLCKNFLEYGMEVENMEFFSVLSVAEKFNIKAAGIFVITNYTNKNAHEDFIKNHTKAMEKLTAYLYKNQYIKQDKNGKV